MWLYIKQKWPPMLVATIFNKDILVTKVSEVNKEVLKGCLPLMLTTNFVDFALSVCAIAVKMILGFTAKNLKIYVKTIALYTANFLKTVNFAKNEIFLKFNYRFLQNCLLFILLKSH